MSASRPPSAFRVVHLCKGTGNGGFIAAWRLHEALLAAGVDSHMVVRERYGRADLKLTAFDDSRGWWLWFRIRGMMSRLLHAALLGRGSIQEFYLQWIPTWIPRAIRRRLKPDLLHVHSPDDGLWALSELSDWKGPITWTFHAYRDFSQGYIYLAHRLDKWMAEGAVGSIHDRDERLIAGLNGALKKRLMSRRRDICISPSRFVCEAGRTSGVFGGSEHLVVRNCVPLEVFRDEDGDRREWRKRHGIDPESFVLLAGAHSLDYPIKGFDLLIGSLGEIAPEMRQAKMVVALFGAGKLPEGQWEGVKIVELGYLDEGGLIAAYRGSDLLVIPSREDNFPNVIIEGLACGLPYVGFDTGGVGDMIAEDPACGEVVPPYDTAALGKSILKFARESTDQRRVRRVNCRNAVERCCSPSHIAARHLELYSKLLHQQS